MSSRCRDRRHSRGGDYALAITRHLNLTGAMHFDLDAATRVHFSGDLYLHGLLQHRFSTSGAETLSLVTRARQFSSLIVLVGSVPAPDTFVPNYAAVVQNQDELAIPLQLATIPTPQEFHDAIESLSPEMQGFAKAIRGMQLESTLFGVLVLQVKPQLEALMNLPTDSLTKEIQLTQDLMRLLTEYQIPSDLLAVDLANGLPTGASSQRPAGQQGWKVEAVKAQVQAMKDMLDSAERQELEDRKRQTTYSSPNPDADLRHFPIPSDSAPDKSRQRARNKLRNRNMHPDAEAPFGMANLESIETVAHFVASSPMNLRTGTAPMQIPGSEGPALTQSGARNGQTALEVKHALQGDHTGPTPRVAQSSAGRDGDSQDHRQGGVDQGHSLGSAGQTSPGPDRQQAQLGFDVTRLPMALDASLSELHVEGALRPTILSVEETVWHRQRKPALLQPRESQLLGPEEQLDERTGALDLIDALTRSGALKFSHASFHVIIAATHCFDKSVMSTVIEDNVSPIEQIVKSQGLLASIIHGEAGGKAR